MNIRGDALDLFAGIGGMTLAAESVGLRIAGAVGISAKEAEIYRYNFGEKLYQVTGGMEKNLSLKDLPETEYILGNIPYMKYNIARNRGRFADARKMHWEMEWFCELLRVRAPKGFVVMLFGCTERDMPDLTQRISRYGYSVYWQMLDSRFMTGMPVHDKKIYLVGIREDYSVRFEFPEISDSYDYRVAELVQRREDDGKLWIDPSKIIVEDKAEIYNCRYVKEKTYERKQGSKYFADQYIRYGAWNPPAVNDGQMIRKISVRELARTKFYPDAFDFDGMSHTAAYQAIGRSVNVSVAAHVIRQLCMQMEAYEPKRNFAGRMKVPEQEKMQGGILQKDNEVKVPETAEDNTLREETVKKETPKRKIVENEAAIPDEKGTGAEQEENKQKIFLSYCQTDQDIANLIEEKLLPLIKDSFCISRDVREVKYRESFKKYMDSVREHEYVMMIISDRYLKSVNCMYEVTEAFKDKEFEKKILFFVLSEEDKKYYRENTDENIAADIYNTAGQVQYTLYWQSEEQKINEQIKQIKEPVNTRGLTEKLKRIREIEMDLPDFFAYISDAKGLPLEIHLKTDFKELRDIIYKASTVE